MAKIKFTLCALSLILVTLCVLSGKASANEGQYLVLIPNELNQPLEIEAFTLTKKNVVAPSLLIDDPKSSKGTGKDRRAKPPKDDEDFEDKIMAMIPHSGKMKQLWNYVDGDTDLYFEGLRADKSNKGVQYTTSTIPLIGDIRGTKFKFSAGDKMEFGFKSNRIPLVGEVKGFSLKGSASPTNNKISARYTMQFD